MILGNRSVTHLRMGENSSQGNYHNSEASRHSHRDLQSLRNQWHLKCSRQGMMRQRSTIVYKNHQPTTDPSLSNTHATSYNSDHEYLLQV